jgi:hypothetical protein
MDCYDFTAGVVSGAQLLYGRSLGRGHSDRPVPAEKPPSMRGLHGALEVLPQFVVITGPLGPGEHHLPPHDGDCRPLSHGVWKVSSPVGDDPDHRRISARLRSLRKRTIKLPLKVPKALYHANRYE